MSALISIVVVLAFTDWGVLAYVLTGLVFAALLLASAITNRRRRATQAASWPPAAARPDRAELVTEQPAQRARARR